MSAPDQSLKKEIFTYAFLIALAMGIGFMVAKNGLGLAGILVALPFILAFIYVVFKNPKNGLFFTFHVGFFVNGLNRFLPPDIPFGLAIDFILALSLIASFFAASKQQAARINCIPFYASLVWFFYFLFEIINPEAPNKEAWFYAGRGLAMYGLMFVPLALMFLNGMEDLNKFIKIWLWWSLIAALYGFKMNIFGVNEGEAKWLEDGGKVTHMIQGRLRIFSFYSEAGQFGAAMAHTALVCLILLIGPYQRKEKTFYAVIMACTFWGFALSGSRGPLFVLVAGFFLYLILIKNFKALTVGAVIGGILFGLLKFTTIGNNNYQIYRMRTALDPNDASLQVRLENQKKLRAYLASRPIGAGIGTGGSWGQRFYKGRWLSDVALDSWYVRVWVETGIIGLSLHIIHLLLIVVIGAYNVFRIRDPDLRQKIMALTCGFFGIVVASYGNQILGQLPTGAVMYICMAVLWSAKRWDDEIMEQKALSENSEAMA